MNSDRCGQCHSGSGQPAAAELEPSEQSVDATVDSVDATSSAKQATPLHRQTVLFEPEKDESSPTKQLSRSAKNRRYRTVFRSAEHNVQKFPSLEGIASTGRRRKAQPMGRLAPLVLMLSDAARQV